jgi:hypothetical protein
MRIIAAMCFPLCAFACPAGALNNPVRTAVRPGVEHACNNYDTVVRLLREKGWWKQRASLIKELLS